MVRDQLRCRQLVNPLRPRVTPHSYELESCARIEKEFRYCRVIGEVSRTGTVTAPAERCASVDRVPDLEQECAVGRRSSTATVSRSFPRAQCSAVSGVLSRGRGSKPSSLINALPARRRSTAASC